MLLDGQIVEEMRLVGNEGERALRLDRIALNVMAGDQDGAARRRNDAGETAKRRGLPRSIGPDEPEHFAHADVEGERANGGERAVELPEISDLDHGRPLVANARSGCVTRGSS